MRPTALLPALLLLLAALPSAAQEEPADTGLVRLRFGWAAGTVAEVETSRRRIRDSGEGADTTAMGVRYRIRVQPHAEGLLVEYTDLRLPPLPEGVEGTEAMAQDFLRRAANLMPSLVVSPDGELLRLDNVARLRAELDSLYAPLLAEAEGAPPQIHAMLQAALSEEGLMASAAQEWNPMIGSWVDGELEPGALYGFEEEEALPQIPGATVLMQYEFGLVERTPCTDAEGAPECVVLEMRSAPEPRALKAVLDGFMQQVMSGVVPGGAVFEELDALSTVVVVLEPGTMRPHRFYTEKRVQGMLRVDGAGAHPISQVDERMSTFSYPE